MFLIFSCSVYIKIPELLPQIPLWQMGGYHCLSLFCSIRRTRGIWVTRSLITQIQVYLAKDLNNSRGLRFCTSGFKEHSF